MSFLGCLRVDIGGEEEGTISSLLPPRQFPSLFGRTSSGPGRGGRDIARGCGTPPPLNSTPSGTAAHSANLLRASPIRGGAFRRQPASPPPPRPKTAQAQVLAGARERALLWQIDSSHPLLFRWGLRGGWRRKMWVGPGRQMRQSDHNDETLFPLSFMTTYNPPF